MCRECLLRNRCPTRRSLSTHPRQMGGRMTPDQIFGGLTEQIMRCHLEAVKQGVGSPVIRSVMTRKTKACFLCHESFRHSYPVSCFPTVIPCDFEFRGSLVDLISGDDYFFHTR